MVVDPGSDECINKYFFLCCVIERDGEEGMGDRGEGRAAKDHGQESNPGQDCAYMVRDVTWWPPGHPCVDQ